MPHQNEVVTLAKAVGHLGFNGPSRPCPIKTRMPSTDRLGTSAQFQRPFSAMPHQNILNGAGIVDINTVSTALLGHAPSKPFGSGGYKTRVRLVSTALLGHAPSKQTTTDSNIGRRRLVSTALLGHAPSKQGGRHTVWCGSRLGRFNGPSRPCPIKTRGWNTAVVRRLFVSTALLGHAPSKPTRAPGLR